MTQNLLWSARVNRILLTLCLTTVWSGWIYRPALAENNPATPAATDAAAKRQAAFKRLSNGFRALEAAAKRIPRDTFSLSDVATSIGNDPAAVSAWVRDHTAWVPYSGALRGPLGVLMDRRGNGLDRATLLAELLRRDGKTVRLAHGTIPDAAAGKLLDVLIAKPVAEQALDTRPSSQALDDLTKQYAEPYGLDSTDLRKFGADLLAGGQRRAEDIVQRTMTQSATLGTMVFGNDPAPAAQPGKLSDAESAALTQALRDHWWVQWQDDAAWKDADLESVDGPLPAPAETIDWAPKDGVYPLSSRQCHEIEVRVIVEKLDDGKLVELPVFSQTLRPMELIGQNISLGSIPLDWPGALDLTKENDPAAKFREVALQQHEWMPMLRIGSRQIHQASFSDAAQINAKPNLDELSKTGKNAGTAARAAVSAFDDNPAPAVPKPTGVLTAQWLEYEIRVPGEPSRQIRREIFDLVGPAARASGAVGQIAIDDAARLKRSVALLGQTDILPMACQVSPAFVDMLSTNNFLRIQKPLLTVLSPEGAAPANDGQLMSELAGVPQMPCALYDVALARGILSPNHSDVYLDRPNILTLHGILRDDGKGRFVYALATDIVANEIAVRPGSSTDARCLRLAMGVLDTNAEAIARSGGVQLPNPSDLLDARPDPSQWLVVKRPDDPKWLEQKVSADMRARINAELAAGNFAAIPRESSGHDGNSTMNWWRIDPRTGSALGIGEQGWGPDMVEYAFVSAVFFSGCMSANILKHGFELHGGAIAICAIAALGSGMTLSGELTIMMLRGYTILGAAAGLGM